MHVHRIRRDVSVLADTLPVPGLGFLAINAFVLHAEQPVVVDTGVSLPDRHFVDTLASAMDPADVRWIWLTHPDRDHTGGIFELLEAAPHARLITTFVGMGIMSTGAPLPVERVYLLNPGQSLNVGDRTLHAFRPPLFDNPATVGFYDDSSGVCFSSDCFGAVVSSAELAIGSDVAAVPTEELRAGQLLWATVDSPWVHHVDLTKYLATIAPLRSLNPSAILSSHLPPATGMGAEFFDTIAAVPGAEPFVGPDQQALEALLAGFEPTPPPRDATKTPEETWHVVR
ncbi:MAG: MBL fold metallo-hydrolase [Micromonosporaceae bacterium]